MRVGMGYDVHKLVEGRPLILGGVEIPHTLGLLGHSDADVLVHAIMDALLGAAALGDIGKHFPDTDPQYKGICHWRICKTVKLRKLCHILPYFFVVCMENMCPILMYMNFLYVLRIRISRNIRSLVNDKNPLSCVCCLSGKDSSK